MKRGLLKYLAVGSSAAVVLVTAPPAAAAGNAGVHVHKTVDPLQLTITSNMAVILAVNHATAIPGDTLTYTAVVTNPTDTFAMGGDINAEANANATATVAYYWDQLEICVTGCGDGTAMNNPHWTAVAAFVAGQPSYVPVEPPALNSGLTLSVQSIVRSGVTYATSGDPILGTQISPAATAGWTYLSRVVLTPAQIAQLSDRTHAQSIRNVIHFEVTARNTNAAQPYTDPEPFSNPFLTSANPGAVSNLAVAFTLPDGSKVSVGAASINPGGSSTATTQFKVPVPAPRGATETEANYESRLLLLDNTSLTATAVASGSGFSGPVLATSSPVSTTENVPIVTIGKSGPPQVNAGNPETNPLSLQNLGGAAAASVTVTDSLPGGATGTVTGTTSPLGPGASGSATATYGIPDSQPDGALTDIASVVWKDANGDSYGPLTSSFTTTVHSSLAGATLTLAPPNAGPDVVGTTQAFTVRLLDQHGVPIPGRQITLAITGANPGTLTGTTDASGKTGFSYSGANAGTDQVQATLTSGTLTLQSNTVAVSWIKPIKTVSTTLVSATVFHGRCCAFSSTPASTPVFTIQVPTVNFNPPEGTIPHNPTQIGVFTRPMYNITTDVAGNFTGAILLQGTDSSGVLHQAGSGDLFEFDMLLTGNFTIAQAGNLTFNFFSDDGFMFGVQGATRVGGPLLNPPASMVTPFTGYPLMAAYNTPTAPVANNVTVNFPAPGSYAYEIDYNECCSGQLALTLATGGKGLPPTGTISLTPFNIAPATVGQTQILHADVMDASGAAIPNLPVTVTITGANPQRLSATTDSTGLATFSYQGASAGQDSFQASAQVSGVPELSNVVTMTWNPAPPAPTITTPTPVDGVLIGKPTPITANISPPQGQSITTWSVAYQSGTGQPVVIAQGSGAPPTQLATFDPTLLTNGTYNILISATASGGGQQTISSSIAVVGGLKLGRYKTTFADMSVPVNGLAMRVLRTYDSTDMTSGDFGVGWRVDLSNFRVASNRVLGAGGWTQYNQSCALGLCLTAFKNSASRFVTVVFPDRHTEVFDFVPTGGTNVFFGCTPAFKARSGTGATSTLVALDDASCSYTGDGNVYGASGPYNPQQFRLTTRSGQTFVLDSRTGLVSEADRNGNSLAIDGSGIHSSSGQSISYTRDASGRISTIVGPSGQTLHYTYTSGGDLASSTSANGAVTTYTYDTNHHLLTTAGPGGPIATFTYDGSGRLTAITNADGNTAQIASNVSGQQQTVTDAAGTLVTVDTFDDQGDIVRIDQIAGGVTHTATMSYDAAGHLTRVSNPAGASTTATYDAAGNLTSITDADGNTSTYSYDALGNLTLATGPGGIALVTVTYDASGNPTSISDGAGHTTAFTHDGAGNVTSRTDPNGHAVSFTYSSNGTIASSTTAAGRSTYTSDASGRLTSATDANGHTTSLTYDADGNVLSEIDAAGHTRSWTYDALDRLVSSTNSNGGHATVTYDAAGRVVGVTDANGVKVTRTFDADGNLLSASAPDGSSATFAYDGFGRMVVATTPAAILGFSYDSNGRVLSQSSGGPQPANTLTYTYDANGLRTSTGGPDGTVRYTYDPLSNLATLTDASGGIFTYSYDPAQRLKSLQRPDGVVDTATYDAAGQLLSHFSAHGGTTLASQAYTYSAAGERTSLADASNTATYTFDPMAQLLSVGNTSGSVPGESYTYDAAGNRTSAGATAVTYDSGGRMTGYGAASYTYDADGQRTSMSDGSGHVTTYSWNAFHQLTGVTLPNGTVIHVGYDALGRRVEVDQGSTATHYQYDGQNLRLQYSGTALATSYTYPPVADTPLEMRQGGTAYYFLTDALGSTIGLADQSGNLVSTQRYDSFGNPVASTGSVANSLTYTGQQYDASTGLYFLNARYYDPHTGTFLSQDPLPNTNPYSYALNDPVDLSDPSGADDPAATYAINLEKDIVAFNDSTAPQTEFKVAETLTKQVATIIHRPPPLFDAAGDQGQGLALLFTVLLSLISKLPAATLVGAIPITLAIAGIVLLIVAVLIFATCGLFSDVSGPATPSGTQASAARRNQPVNPCAGQPQGGG